MSPTLREADAQEVLDALAAGYSVVEVAGTFGLSRQAIGAIRNGRAWRHLPRPPQLPTPYRKPVEARRCIVVGCGRDIGAERIRRSPTVMTCSPLHSRRHRAELQRRASRRKAKRRRL